MKSILLTGLFLAVFACAPAARSQQSPSDQTGTTPVSPDQPLPSATDSSSGDTKNAGAAPAGRSVIGSDATAPSQGETEMEGLPLSGAQELGPALFAGEFRNYFDASALVSGSADSGVINTQGTPSWGGGELLGGQLTYDHMWSGDRFSLSYLGGGEFYQPSALFPDAMFHALSASQSFTWNRAKLILIDEFSYSPDSLFGGAGIGGPGLLAETGAATNSSLNSTYSAGTTILTGQTRLESNAAVAEGEYFLSRRTSLTATGDFGLLNYAGGGYISSHDYVFGGGINRLLTPKDTLAVTYSFTEDVFQASPERLDAQLVNLAYAHQVTDRFVFQISGGPEFVSFRNYTPSVGNALTWGLSAAASYRLRRTTFGASYTHGVNSGSGVYSGSVSQTLAGTVSHQFSRFLVGSVTFGYSDSSNLAPTLGITNQFHNYYVAVNAGRQLGRRAHINFNYGVQQQPYSGICPVTSCGTNQAVQTIGIALDVHLHPIDSVE